MSMVSESAAPARNVIVACMRNEALFVVEWIAHHITVGFDRIIVYTNDCDDGTDRLLDLLGQGAPVERFDNPGPYEAGTIQKQALAMAFDLPQVRGADWVLHIDADEYVNIEVGARKVDDLVALHPDADAIALLWRHFGSAGKTVWEGGSVIESFRRCEPAVPDMAAGVVAGFKTLFRPSKFTMMSVHTPKLPVAGVMPKVVSTAGVDMPLETILARRGSGYLAGPSQVTWENASLHHHHVKSDDLHRLKHGRGDANGRGNRKRLIGSSFYAYANRNEAISESLVQLRPAVREVEARLRALPGVAEAEAEAWAWFRRHYGVEAEGEDKAPSAEKT